jgi:opacity protein-like surface antigen
LQRDAPEDLVTYSGIKRLVFAAVAATAVVVASAAPAHAQGFISPFIGYDFGGDSGCANATGCTDKKLNWGVSFGALGPALGFEEEFAYARNFFGDIPGQSSSVLTLMSNLMVAPAIGPVRPYAVGGIGLMKTNVDFNSSSSLLNASNNNAAWDLGAGVMGYFGDHVGIRGEIRHFRSFSDFDILGVTVNNTKLRYNRASAGVVFKF